MSHIEGEIIIDRPVDTVFDFVADERNEPLYNPEISHAELVTEEPIGEGTRFVAFTSTMGRPLEMVIEFTGYERPKRLSSTTVMSTADTRGTLTFEPDMAGTRMHWSWEVRPKGLMKLLAPVLIPLGRRQERTVWANLKRHLEGRPS